MAENGQRRDPSSHRTPGQITRQVKGYNATPANTKKRSLRNQARALVEKRVGKAALIGKDIDHKRPVRSGGGNGAGNLRVRDRSANRAWRAD